VELGRGTLKQLILLLIILGIPFFLMAQEEGSPQENDFPVINENDLTLFDENPQAVVEDEIPSTVGFSDLEVGNQIFLIGSGSSDVNLISEITDQETLDQIHLDQEAPPSQGKANFSKLLRKGLSLGSGRKIVDQSPGFLRSQRDRLKDLGDQS
jgi:hypothetical protein